MPIDHCLHSLFGVSKAAADLLVQEYGRYFGIPTVSFRAGCLTVGRFLAECCKLVGLPEFDARDFDTAGNDA